MENLDLIILTVIVTVLYVGFAWGLFAAQKKQQHLTVDKSLEAIDQP